MTQMEPRRKTKLRHKDLPRVEGCPIHDHTYYQGDLERHQERNYRPCELCIRKERARAKQKDREIEWYGYKDEFADYIALSRNRRIVEAAKTLGLTPTCIRCGNTEGDLQPMSGIDEYICLDTKRCSNRIKRAKSKARKRGDAE